MILRCLFVVLTLSLVLPTLGQSLPPVPPTDIMPLASVREGMKGIARTVFRGTEPEEFGVEVLGIIPNAVGPGADMIVGKLSGANAERTFVFAGMSGSPVYVDGKLVGAIAYSFPFAKEPMCGITPIEQMISMVESVPDRRPSVSFSFRTSELQAADWRQIARRPAGIDPEGSIVGAGREANISAGQRFTPIATPMAFSGVSESVVRYFARDLASTGAFAVSAAGSSSATAARPIDERTLVGGTSVVAHLSRGDIGIQAAGTVTLRSGSRIYAFGHPYFGLGSADLPMAESHVITVVPNVNNSFKLAVADGLVGSITQDRATGVYGELGRSPRTIPVSAKIKTSRGAERSVRFDMAIDEFLSPLILNVGLLNALTANERSLGDMTVDIRTKIYVKGERPVIIERRTTGSSGAALAAAAPAVPLALLMKSGFEGLEITKIETEMIADEGSLGAALERISVDRSQVRAGETVNVIATLRSDDGRVSTMSVPVRIPEGIAAGSLTLQIADGSVVQQASAAQNLTASNTAELIGILNDTRRADRLYALLTRTSAGAVIGSKELPDLPPSALATINSDRAAGGSKALTTTVIAESLLPGGERILSGSQTVTIEVVR
ncbi:MAG: hypothetical protein KF736_08765 [Acidobacteria bacterium]|nr:hypothetical protein [Acidobacteriota bacterium]MCW5950144.1 hypothetical protein [Pyrinomonadaceae bacterium]